MNFHQVAVSDEAPEGPVVHAEARVTAVWIGPDGRPVRIPQDVRQALGPG